MLSQVLGQTRSSRRAVTLAAFLVVLDAFYLNQGVIAALVGAGLLLIGVPRALTAKLSEVRRQRLRNLGIYFTAVVLVFALDAANNHLARTRAEHLVVAVKAYQAKYHRYPQSLNDLMPEFVDRVPLAKYTLAFNEFHYFTSKRGTHLFYVALPPFGRPGYSFVRDQWTSLD